MEMLALSEQTRVAREEHNLTQSPLLRLPAELRLQIQEYVTDSIRGPQAHQRFWPNIPADFSRHTTAWLRTCRLLRAEMLPLYLTGPGLLIDCHTTPGRQPAVNKNVDALERWLSYILAERDVTCDKLLVRLHLAGRGMLQYWQIIMEPEREHAGFHQNGSGMLESASEDDDDDEEDVTSAFDAEVMTTVSAMMTGLNERAYSERKGTEKEDLHRLFALLCGREAWRALRDSRGYIVGIALGGMK